MALSEVILPSLLPSLLKLINLHLDSVASFSVFLSYTSLDRLTHSPLQMVHISLGSFYASNKGPSLRNPELGLITILPASRQPDLRSQKGRSPFHTPPKQGAVVGGGSCEGRRAQDFPPLW